MSCKFESIVENYSCDVAAGVGTQAANCEAPERMSPSSWCNPVKMGCVFNSATFSDNLAGNGMSLYVRNVLIIKVLVDIDNAPLPAR